MARYDFGWRGARQTTRPWPWTDRAPFEDYRVPRRRPNTHRVVAPYNLDYVRESGPRYPRNPNPYGGEWYGQMLGEDEYRPPYITRTGTHTTRGIPRNLPMEYDVRDYGPDYGGYYPDEL